MKRRSILAGAVLSCLLLVAHAQADPVSLGVWYEFAFMGQGSSATACTSCIPSSGTPTTFAPSPPWTFTLTAPGHLVVTDAFLVGDRFEVFNSGTSLGLTSLPTAGVGPCGDDPVPCLADPNFSSATFLLGAGSYSIAIDAVLSPWGAGAAYFRAEQVQGAVPEPATWALVAGVIALVAGKRYRRRRDTAVAGR